VGQLLLGVDVGTYSSKGVLVEPNGNILNSHVVEHKMDVPQPGWAEQDADEIWWKDVIQICRVLVDGFSIKSEDIAGVAFSAIGPTLVVLDDQDKPLRPGILYGVDTRATEEIDILNRKIGEDTVFEFSKMAFTSQSIGPKILWVKRNEPKIWKKVKHLTTASSYLVLRATGEKVIDRHTASHYMPLIDMQKLEWSNRFSEDLVDLRMLPRLGWSDHQAGVITSKAAEETGLKIGTPVAVGTVDALSEAISVGAVSPGDLMIMYGSTTFFILVTENPIPDPRVWTTGGAFKGQYNLAAGMSTTGSITRWFRDEFTRDIPTDQGYGHLFSAAENIEPGAGGLIVLPYFSGERTPINDPNARGIIAGLTLSHTREHVFRAMLEGVAYGIRHNIETFQNMGAPIIRILAVGGGTKSTIWPRIVSSVCKVKQIIPELTIGASYGDAFLAGLSSGILQRSDLSSWVKVGKEIVPDTKQMNFYELYFQQYRKLYENTREIIHGLHSP